MKPSKKQQQRSKSGKLKGNHQKKKGPVFIYFILFVAVSITMITLNQVRKRNEKSGINREQVNRRDIQFTKEGELEFLNSGGELITSIDIEIADDDIQTQRGMMYRRSMKQNQGMLFIFPDEEVRSFWMKNTLISLDIIYLDSEKNIVSISENAPPKSEQSIWSDGPAKYVVEVVAGFVAQHQIKAGDKMEFRRSY
jgi:uncharacterized membrane protein (UPF0127 family)